MKKEIRIPILGVIEESETLNGNERYFLDHYPHGEGVYLVKIGSCYMELRDVHIRNEKTPNDRIKCDFAIYPIRSSAVVEEIKKEHEATLKDYIEECCVKILTSVNANRDDVRNVDEKMSVLINNSPLISHVSKKLSILSRKMALHPARELAKRLCLEHWKL